MEDKKHQAYCKSCEKIDNFLKVDLEKENQTFSNSNIKATKHDSSKTEYHHKDHDRHDEHDDHENHKGHKHNPEPEQVKIWKLVIGVVLLVFVLVTHWVSIDGNEDLTSWFQFGAATATMILIGYEFWKETIKDAMKRHLSVEILVTISSSFAYIFSTIYLILHQTGVAEANNYFFEATVEILVIIYFGRFLEYIVTKKAINEIDVIKSLIPNKALMLINGKELEVNAKDLNINDIVLVKKGQMIPADGVIIEGDSIVLETSFTGEVNNDVKHVGDAVLAGTIASSGIIKVKIQKQLSNSFILEIVNGLSKTNEFKPKTQNIADFVASILIPSVFFASIMALILWGSLSDDWYNATQIMIAVMVIACPCSLGLTTPTSILVGSSVSSRLGIFFNSKNVFESFKEANVIVFDKTGTLTKGELEIEDTNLSEKYLAIIKKVEDNFTHPISKSLVKNINSNIVIDGELKFEEHESLGIEFNYENNDYFFGSIKFVKSILKDFVVNQEYDQKLINGSQLLFLFNKKEVIGFIELSDPIKESAYEAISKLKEQNIEVAMLTGDNSKTANYIGQKLGIKAENIFAEVNPLEKQDKIIEFQKDGKSVIFVGDGNNDAIAMKQSNLSISMNSGTDVAVKISDVTILDNDLNKILDVIYISKKTLFNIYRGFGISIGYNVIAIPLALAGLVGPLLASFMMMISDTIAIFNSLTLRLILYKKEYRNKKSKRSNK